MSGFVNDGSSCFIDSILIALFGGDTGDAFVPVFFSPNSHTLQHDDGKEAAWERAATPPWRLAVQAQLYRYYRMLQGGWEGGEHGQGAESMSTVSCWRGLFLQVAAGDNNFGVVGEVHSAVDFLRYLFAIFRVRDSLTQVQVSTTVFQQRAEVAAAGADLSALTDLWLCQRIVGKYTHENALMCPDASEADMLVNDTAGKWTVFVTENGDLRRMGGVDSASIFLCHLTPEDANESSVRIDRELLPHAQVLSGQAEYKGTVGVVLTATRLLHAPVLIFEVSRKVQHVLHNRLVEFKSPTPVHYVDSGNKLFVHGQAYELRSVVCHEGSADSGHYYSFVWRENQWYKYDDAAYNGKFQPVSTIDTAVRQCGELFVYVRV